MASSLPAALEWLVDRVGSLEVVRELRPAVSDGWPAVRDDLLIALGVTPEEDDAGVLGSYAELSREEYETVELPAIVVARRAGSTASRDARRDAFAMFDAIRGLVGGDRRFGGAIRPGLPARVARWSMTQTADVRQAGEGRVCEIRFVLTWQHRG